MPVHPVSIHALLAECDAVQGGNAHAGLCFNPRTPCGVRLPLLHVVIDNIRFQSTHSLRSATAFGPVAVKHSGFQSTHSLRSATKARPKALRCWEFQSTHSLRSATRKMGIYLPADRVSIHALLAECDSMRSAPTSPPCWFQSTHSLRSATRSGSRRNWSFWFQSTHSLRSATAPDHIHCYSTAQTILCANLPKKAIIT